MLESLLNFRFRGTPLSSEDFLIALENIIIETVSTELCADRHNAHGNGFNTSPACAASYVARSFSVFFLLRSTQRTFAVCRTAGAQVLTMSSLMTWYPCFSGPALHCRVPFSPLCFFSPRAEGTGMPVVFSLDCIYLLSTGVVVLSCRYPESRQPTD